ncbi:MAG: DUF6273 domain-containing protein [Defluviitaleaceae bacterium]|nr:DUF6273 domain-containing protein [Defluviitaleaceae bacterium]
MQNMYDAMSDALQTIYGRFGSDIFGNPNRFVSALNDLVTGVDSGKVKNLLRIAVCDLNAFTRLHKATQTGDIYAALKISKEMSDDFMLPIEISTEIVNRIASLAGFHPVSAEALPSNQIPPTAIRHSTSASQASSNIVRFGKYDWRVLSVQNGRALMLCEKLIIKMPFHNVLTNITWENTSLCKYLNTVFLNTFTKIEQSRIMNKNIFLLDIDEVLQYFGDSGQAKSGKTLIDDRFNIVRKAIGIDGLPAWWWLRSSGEDTDFAAYVSVSGMIHMDGFLVNIAGGAGGGVRPALWLNLTDK